MYGYPGPGAVQDSEEGKVHLGGCIVDINNPKWHCKDCERDWQIMEVKLSTDSCPDCLSEKITRRQERPYGETLYSCNECKTLWSKKTRYCKKCLDVVQYCKCYEDMYE